MHTSSIELKSKKTVSKFTPLKVEMVYPLANKIISKFESGFVFDFLLDANEVFHYGYEPVEGERENGAIHSINELLRNGVLPWIKSAEDASHQLANALLAVYNADGSNGFKSMIDSLHQAYAIEIMNQNTSDEMEKRYKPGMLLLKSIHQFFQDAETA